MIRILVATADPAASGALLGCLRAAFGKRVQLEVVSGALYALTSLERQCADLIICNETLEDMSGRELFELVCDDAGLRQLPFILLSGAADDLVLPDHQLVLAAQTDLAEVLAAALSLLFAAGKLAEVRKDEVHKSEVQKNEVYLDAAADALKARYKREYERGAVKVGGTLEALSLFDLVVSLGQGKCSGRLIVLSGGAEGTLYLKGGRLCHATLAQTIGEDALQRIFAQVHYAPQTPFLFIGELPAKTPKTIRTSLDKLLLQVAVMLDERLGEQVPA